MRQAAGRKVTAWKLLPVPPHSLSTAKAPLGGFGSPGCPGQLMGYGLQEGTLNSTTTGHGVVLIHPIHSCCLKIKLVLALHPKHFQMNLERNQLPFLSIQSRLYTGYTAWHNILPEMRAAVRTSILQTQPVPETALQTTAFSQLPQKLSFSSFFKSWPKNYVLFSL